MELIKTKNGINWISQFKNESSRLLAKSFLNSLTLVSFSKFEHEISSSIKKISKSSEGKIALFPVKKQDDEDKYENFREIKQDRFGSEGRVGHLLTNIQRGNQRKFVVSPTVKCMRTQKIREFVIVDDIIGSGNRILTYWKKSINSSVKSWISYKKVRFWIVSYAANTTSIIKLINAIGPLTDERLLATIKISSKPLGWDDDLKKLFIYYGQKTSKPGAALGYNNSLCTVVFQHGCPNNCPAILWACGKNWKALFPNRSIPDILYQCFENPVNNIGIDSLFNTGNYKLAINLLNGIENNYLNSELVNIMIFLGLINRGVKLKNICNYMPLGDNTIRLLANKCLESFLLDPNYSLTEFGVDILDRFRNYKEKHSLKNHVIDNKNNEQYCPTQFLGYQRKFSGFPDT